MEEKALLRAAIRQLHPDLFVAYPTEQEINATALKGLNHYLDELTAGNRPEPVALQFWVKRGDTLKEIATRLENDGLLAPLYFSLGLINEQDYLQWTAEGLDGGMDEDLLDWLRSFVSKVVEDGEQHGLLRMRLSQFKTEMEATYQLKSLQVGPEFGMGVADLKLQLDLLGILEEAMRKLRASSESLFAGLSLCVHQPDGSPLTPTAQSDVLRSWISDDGCLHVVVQSMSMDQTLKGLDLDRASLLTRLHSFWECRAAELRASMKELFQVEEVLCDISTGASAQQFVLWAGCILANRQEIRDRLSHKEMPLTLLVHSDDSAPMVDYSTASSTLHVRTDCSSMSLLNYVQSDRCLNAIDEAKEMLTDDLEEQKILEEARKALGAKHVIRICSIYERQHAIKAAERLIENAESIRQAIDLSDAGIAIDSNYQAWESGFISIPYDYHMTELRPNLKKLIGDGKKELNSDLAPGGFDGDGWGCEAPWGG